MLVQRHTSIWVGVSTYQYRTGLAQGLPWRAACTTQLNEQLSTFFRVTKRPSPFVLHGSMVHWRVIGFITAANPWIKSLWENHSR